MFLKVPFSDNWSLFIAYTEDLSSVVEEHNMDPNLYADNCQLNDHLLLSIPKMENCVDAVHKWSAFKHLQVNPSKTEVIWFGINVNLKELQSFDLRLHVGADTIAPVVALLDLGVILDGELTVAKHIAKIPTSLAPKASQTDSRSWDCHSACVGLCY